MFSKFSIRSLLILGVVLLVIQCAIAAPVDKRSNRRKSPRRKASPVHHPAVHHPAVHHQAVHHPAVHRPAVHRPAVHHPAVRHQAVHHAGKNTNGNTKISPNGRKQSSGHTHNSHANAVKHKGVPQRNAGQRANKAGATKTGQKPKTGKCNHKLGKRGMDDCVEWDPTNPDNLDLPKNGHKAVHEDNPNSVHYGKVWSYDQKKYGEINRVKQAKINEQLSEHMQNKFQTSGKPKDWNHKHPGAVSVRKTQGAYGTHLWASTSTARKNGAPGVTENEPKRRPARVAAGKKARVVFANKKGGLHGEEAIAHQMDADGEPVRGGDTHTTYEILPKAKGQKLRSCKNNCRKVIKDEDQIDYFRKEPPTDAQKARADAKALRRKKAAGTSDTEMADAPSRAGTPEPRRGRSGRPASRGGSRGSLTPRPGLTHAGPSEPQSDHEWDDISDESSSEEDTSASSYRPSSDEGKMSEK